MHYTKTLILFLDLVIFIREKPEHNLLNIFLDILNHTLPLPTGIVFNMGTQALNTQNFIH